MTDVILDSLQSLSREYSIPLLPAVRTDSTVPKATCGRTFLLDFDPKCKAVEDYKLVADQLLSHLKGQLNERQFTLPAEALESTLSDYFLAFRRGRVQPRRVLH